MNMSAILGRRGISVVAVAALAVMAFLLMQGTAGSGGGIGESFGIKGIVSYEVRGADGVLKAFRTHPNATLDLFLNNTRDRLGKAGEPAAVTGDDNLVDNIQACSGDVSGAACTLAANLTANPIDGTNATLAETGNYETVATFTANGASTIEELQLSSGAVVNATAQTTRNAWQNVSITLAATDTLTVTWTIDID